MTKAEATAILGLVNQAMNELERLSMEGETAIAKTAAWNARYGGIHSILTRLRDMAASELK